MLIKIIGLLCFITGLVSIIIGIKYRQAYLGKVGRCVKRVEGLIKGNKEISKRNFIFKRKLNCPIIECDIDGIKQVMEFPYGSKEIKYKEGSKIYIYYEPNELKDYYIECNIIEKQEANNSIIRGVIICIISIILLI